MTIVIANDLEEMKVALINFFNHQSGIEICIDGIDDQMPIWTKYEFDLEKNVDMLLTDLIEYCYEDEAFNTEVIELDLDIPEIDLELQDELAAKLIAEGYENTYIINDDIFAFHTEMGKDEAENTYKKWYMARHIANGRREITIIYDYYSKSKLELKKTDEEAADSFGLVRKRCPFCGHFSTHRVPKDSWPDINPPLPDLDFKDAYESEEDFETYIQICSNPRCKYAAPDISKPAKVSGDFLKTKVYRECDGMKFASDIAAGFFRRYLICTMEEDIEGAFRNLRYAAWICDEREDYDNARTCRIKALPCIEELIKKAKRKYDREYMLIIKADFLRRTGQFDILTSEFKNVQIDNKVLRMILIYELELARNKDSLCHSQEEIRERFLINER